jgi:hypothetical protein
MLARGVKAYGRTQWGQCGDQISKDKPLLVSCELGVGTSLKFGGDARVVILVDSGSGLSEGEILQYVGRGNRRVGIPVGHVICISDDFPNGCAL